MNSILNKINPFKIPIRLTVALATLAITTTLILLIAINSSPDDIGPAGITIMFVLLYVAVLTTLTLVKMLFLRTTTVSLERLVGISLIPVIILAMRSLRQLTVVDIVLIIAFALLVNIYISKATQKG